MSLLSLFDINSPEGLLNSFNELLFGVPVSIILLVLWTICAIKLNGKKATAGVSLMFVVITMLLSGLSPPLVPASLITIFIILTMLSLIFIP
jgi:hypothetical protein